MSGPYMLRVPALEIRQGSRRVYALAVDGKRLSTFATVSRVHRDAEQQLGGYQRPEVARHIRTIARYLESPGALMPNALVVAFDARVRFAPASGVPAGDSVPGELLIPVDEDAPETERPAWLVDGQQRAAALRDADVAAFSVPLIGFIADPAQQREQFVRVNSTKPLPRGLIHELLPEIDGPLSPTLARKHLPAKVMTRLLTTEGPFCGAIASPTAPDGYIKDNSVLKMIENSLYEGALYQYRNPVDGTGDIDRMVAHLTAYWQAVASTWPAAWKLPPRQSRLTHGVGIQAMGFVMDHLTENLPAEKVPGRVKEPLARLQEEAAWTSGTWRLGDGHTRDWRGWQNTSTDVRLLTTLLLRIIDQQSLPLPT